MRPVAAAAAAALVALAGCSGGGSGAESGADRGAEPARSIIASPVASGADAPILPCTGLGARVDGAAGDSGGRALPDLTLDCLGGGEPVTLRDLRGPLVLNLWASWCLPCRAELPFLTAAHQALGDRVRFAGIAVSDFDKPATEWMSFHGVGWPSLTDRKGSTRGPLRAPGPPVTLFVNSEGSIVWVHYGPFTSADQVQDAIAEHLGVPGAVQSPRGRG